MREREVITERPVAPAPAEREIVVDDRPRRGGGGGAVVAIVGIILVLIVAWFLLNALGILSDAAEDSSVTVPDEVQVDVNEE